MYGKYPICYQLITIRIDDLFETQFSLRKKWNYSSQKCLLTQYWASSISCLELFLQICFFRKQIYEILILWRFLISIFKNTAIIHHVGCLVVVFSSFRCLQATGRALFNQSLPWTIPRRGNTAEPALGNHRMSYHIEWRSVEHKEHQ